MSLGSCKEIDQLSLAYAAGYMDGEASFNIYNNRLILQIESCSDLPLNFLANIFKVVIRPLNRKTKRNRQVYRMAVSGKTAYSILSLVSPFMLEKRAKAIKMLSTYEQLCEKKANQTKNCKVPA